MNLFDLALVVNGEGEIANAAWGDDEGMARRLHCRIKKGMALAELFPGAVLGEQGEATLSGKTLAYRRMEAVPGVFIYLFSARPATEYLFEQALERFTEGVQIYDREGYLVYCNQTSRRISAIPPDMDVIGKHMLDIWNVKEENSASFSSMRTNAPVKNRVDRFPTIFAGEVTTVNTAYPLALEGGVCGAVLLEYDITAIQREKKEIESMLDALRDFAGHPSAEKLSGYSFEHIIGRSASLRTAVELSRKFASADCHILLIGETGTGKEMFAQSIHRESARGQKGFVAINCAAMPDTLIESMLFGTTKGAFTGSENKAGLLEEANGGTLFLDELNSMSLVMQSKILRVVQEGVYRRVGGGKDLTTDVRIISTTNEDPFRLVEVGKMRRDLFYRLSSVQIQIPPLRERLDDLEPLIERYIQIKKKHFAKGIDYVAPEVLALFREHHWPGNVRELFNVLDYAMNVLEDGIIDTACLPSYFTEQAAAKREPVFDGGVDIYSTPLADLVGSYEAALLTQVLEHYGSNISRAAASLGICRQSLSYRMRKYGIVI